MTDDDLRERLRRADPAASLPPVSDERLMRLLEETMTTTTPSRTPATRRRVLTAAAAAVLAVAGGSGYLLNRSRPDDKSGATVALPSPAPSSAGVAAITLKAGGGPAAKCAQPDPANIKKANVAFAGTVTNVSGTTYTLHVIQLFAGPRVTDVKVDQGDFSEAVDFQVGREYLVSAFEGNVASCLSGATSAELREIYDQAF